MNLKLIVTTAILPISLSTHALPTADDLQGTINLCAAGRSLEVKANINASLKQWLKGAAAKGEAKISDMGAIIKETKNDKIRVEALSVYHECVKTVLPIFIAADVQKSKASADKKDSSTSTNEQKSNGSTSPNISFTNGSSGTITINN